MNKHYIRDPCIVKCKKCKKKFITNEKDWYIVEDSELAKYMNEPTGTFVDCHNCKTTLNEDNICEEKK